MICATVEIRDDGSVSEYFDMRDHLHTDRFKDMSKLVDKYMAACPGRYVRVESPENPDRFCDVWVPDADGEPPSLSDLPAGPAIRLVKQGEKFPKNL